jgi:hypothetical protein
MIVVIVPPSPLLLPPPTRAEFKERRDPGEYWETVGRVEREGESGVGSYWKK